MKMNGVPQKGKWLTVDGGLHIQIPYGTAYGKDDDGNWDMIELENCSSYKSGPFTADDEAPFRWKLSGLHPQSVSIGDDVPPAVRSQLPRLLQLIAVQMTGGKPSEKPYELGSSTQVEETEEGFTLRSSISASEAGGTYQIFEISSEKAFAVIEKNIQIMGITLGFRYVLLALASPSGAKFFMGSLAVPDANGDLEKMAQAVRPLLESARLGDPAAPAAGSRADRAKKAAGAKTSGGQGKKKASAQAPKAPAGGPRKRVTGLPKGGSRVQLLDGLSLSLPDGAVYYYDEEQNACFGMPEETPEDYREGTFSMPEDTPMLWQVTKLHHEGTVSYEPEKKDASEANKLCFESFRENMGNIANGIAETMTRQLSGLGGTYAGKLDLAEEDRMLSYVWAKNELLEERYFPGYFFVGLPSSFEMPIFMGYYDPVDIPVFEQQLLPVLRSVQRIGDAAKEINVSAAAALAPISFEKGQRIEAGPFTALVPRGLHASPYVNPKSRLLTCIPAHVSFQDPKWAYNAAIQITLQTGQDIPPLQANLDTEEGERELRALLERTNLPQSGVTAAGRGRNHCTAYYITSQEEHKIIYGYYVVTKSQIYLGQYLGVLDSPEDLRRHEEILRRWLQELRYAPEKQDQAAREQTQMVLGELAAPDGKLSGLEALKLFTDDLIFFGENDMGWDGAHHIFQGIQINQDHVQEHPELVEMGQTLTSELSRLIGYLEEDERLRVPAGQLHSRMRAFLHGQDVTGMSYLHLAAWNLFKVRSEEEGLLVLVDVNLLKAIPGAETHLKELLWALRRYNGLEEEPSVTFATFRNLDGNEPFSGELLEEEFPVECVPTDRTEVEAEKGAGKETGLGRFAGADGRLDAFMGLAFFTEDVIFFHREDLVWDGKYHSFAQYRFNIGVLGHAEGVMEHSNAILSGMRELIDELEHKEALRVPAEDLHPGMRDFLRGEDFTPAVLFYLACFHLFSISEEEPDRYEFRQDYRIHETLPDPEGYFTAFLGALRAYNGNPKPFTAELTGTFGMGGAHLPDIAASEYELDEDGFVVMDENGEAKLRQKTPEEVAWQERMEQKKLEAELAKVPFSPVTSVTLSGSTFVLTGTFRHCGDDREKIKSEITAKGGRVTGAISGKTNYLVIGSLGDFGARKLEQAQEQRAKGKNIQIIREEDLVCALEGRPIPKGTPKKTAPAAQKEPAARKEPDVRVRSVPPRPGEMARVEVTAQLPRVSVEPEETTREEAAAQLLNVLRVVLEKAEKQQADYDSACRSMEKAKTAAALRKAAKTFEELEGYQDSGVRRTRCLERAQVLEEERKKKKAEEKARREAEQAAARQQADYDSACQAMEKAKSITAFRKAAKAFEALNGYRDSAERQAQCLERVKALEEEKQRKKAEEQARLEKEQAEQAAAAQAQREKMQAQKEKRRKKLLLAAALVAAAIGIFFGVRRYMDGAPYRELARSIDEGTFHYSQYEESYFLQYDDSYRVIAGKLTDFHREDDIQSAVDLIGSLPPDESSIDYYINGWEIYMTDSFRLWFLERVSEEGTALSTPEGMEYQGDEVTGVYQLGDYWVMTVYNEFLEDDGRPEQAYVCEAEEGDGWVYLGSYQNRNNQAGQQYGIE